MSDTTIPKTSVYTAAFNAEAARIRRRRTLHTVLDYALMSLIACFFMFPIVIMVVSSLKPESLVSANMHTIYAFIPREASLNNYSCPNYQAPTSPCYDTAGGVFDRLDFGRLMFNSIFIVTTIVGFGLLVNSMAAYALSRLNWFGRKTALNVIVALIIIPFEAIAVPLLLLCNSLPWFGGKTSWLDTYHVQIIPFIADAFSIYLFYQFFIDIPKDFDEAARVDGASGFMIYWRIIVPLSRPVFATVAILQFLTHWGDFLWPLMTTRGDDFRPLTVGMQIFFGQEPRQWGDIMAFASMVTIPVLIVFLLFQRWFIQSVASSGVKG